jgi:hypothetical protein
VPAGKSSGRITGRQASPAEDTPMHLCSYIVHIEVPDNFTIQKQDRALEAIDALNLPPLIEGIVRTKLSETSGLRCATVLVEE